LVVYIIVLKQNTWFHIDISL